MSEKEESNNTKGDQDNNDQNDKINISVSKNRLKNHLIYLGLSVFLFAVVFAGIFVLQNVNNDTGNSSTVEFDFPNGTSQEGFNNSTEIGASHSLFLSDKSYTIELDSVSESNGTSQTFFTEYRYDPESGLGLRVEDSTQLDGQRQFVQDFINGELFAVRGLNANNTNTTYDRASLQQSFPYTARFNIEQFISEIDYNFSRTVQRNNEKFAVYNSQDVPQSLTNVTSIDVEVQLSERGYIRSINATIEFSDQEEQVVQNQSIEIINVGSTDVEEPDWVEEAREQTNNNSSNTG